MMENPFPTSIKFYAITEPPSGLALPAEEQALCARWLSEERKQQFFIGRAAAHFAIGALGRDSTAPISRGAQGEPLWPEGIVGCISNTKGCAVAAVGLSSEFRSLGLDIERVDRNVSQGICRHVCTPAELRMLGAENGPGLLQVFTAKECLYKALFPLCRCYIAFQEVELTWKDEQRCWGVRLLKELPNVPPERTLSIYTTRSHPYILSSMAISR